MSDEDNFEDLRICVTCLKARLIEDELGMIGLRPGDSLTVVLPVECMDIDHE